MASISGIPTTAPLPRVSQGAAAESPVPASPGGLVAPTAAVPVPGVQADSAAVPSGQEALNRVATTPLWSSDFELPSAPSLPSPAKSAWNWESTPDISANYAGAVRTPTSPSRQGAMAFGSVPDDEEDEDDGPDLSMLEWIFVPTLPIARAVFDGGAALVGAVGKGAQDLAGQVGHAAQQVVGTVGHVVQDAVGHVGHVAQQAANAVADAAKNAWNAITSFRLW